MKPAFLAALLAFAFAGPAAAQLCNPTPEVQAVRILGVDLDGAPTPTELPFVAGERGFFQLLENGWVFALVPVEHGWAVRMYENAQIGDAVDLTSLTPPHGGAPNPRDILGWHFRNANNTGANDGSVNAPTDLRAFVLSPALAGTGGFKPSTNADEPRLSAPEPGDGIGWLKVIDYGLADLQPGKRARMNYLKFDACLSWPRPEAERLRLVDLSSPAFSPEDREIFGACGLDFAIYDLDARHTPRTLGGDIDGDGALDVVAQATRLADGKRGLALCRAGTWLDLIGFTTALGDMEAGYPDSVEAWQWLSGGDDRPVHLHGIDLPSADGDLLVLERIEKEAVVVFWYEDALRAKRVYRHVEP